jgi:tetratricopeptide (TPR) repeat protein
MLRSYAGGAKTPDVLREALGLTPAEFDQRSLAWLQTHVFSQIKMLRSYSTTQLEDLKDAVDERAEDAAARAELAAAYFAFGKRTDAELQAGRALQLDAKNALAHLVLGRLSQRDQDHERTRRHLEAAIAGGREDFHAYLVLGNIYARQDQDLGRAEAAWKRAKACFPFYVGAGSPYRLLADLYKQRGDLAAWANELAEVAARENTDIELRKQLVSYHRDRKEHDAVVKYGRELLEIDPFQTDVLLAVSDVLVSTKRYDQAIPLLKLAIASKPKTDQHQFFTLLATCYVARGDTQRARALVEEALAIRPDYEPARQLLEDLR